MEFGKWLYYTGIVLVLLGMVVMRFPRSIAWFGKLPGDFRIQNARIKVIPVTSIIIVGVVLTVCARLVQTYFGGER